MQLKDFEKMLGSGFWRSDNYQDTRSDIFIKKIRLRNIVALMLWRSRKTHFLKLRKITG